MLKTEIVIGRVIVTSLVGCVVLTLANAEAQTTKWTNSGFISINGGSQVGNKTFEATASIQKLAETANFNTDHAWGGGVVFDLSGGIRLWRSVAVSLGVSLFAGNDDISGRGTVPHPLFFDRPRNVTFVETGLKHREVGVHFSAVYVIPLTNRIHLLIFGGPTLFNLRQDMVNDVEIGPETDIPLFETVGIMSVSAASVSGTGLGGHFGFDGTFLLTEQIGIGGFFRYAAGSVDLPTADNASIVDVGGAQLGGGVRLFF